MEEKKKEQDMKDSLIGLAQGEIVQRHGEASSQILQAYKGIRVDHNGHLEDFHGRNLKQISEYNLGDNPDVSRKQQSGFSAELIKEVLETEPSVKETTKEIISVNTDENTKKENQIKHR